MPASAGSKTRIYILFILVLIVGLILIGRLYELQVVRANSFKDRADRQYIRQNYSLFDRGDIYFTDKNDKTVSAATLKSGYTLAINPSEIKDIDIAYSQLSSIVEIPKEDFYQKASKKDDPYEELATRLSEDVMTRVVDLDIDGVQLFQERWRYYPGDTLGASVLGFVGYDGNHLNGRYGLERQYESVLSRGESDAYVNFFAEVFSNLKGVIAGDDEKGDIVTTIDPAVQSYLEQELEEVQEIWYGDLSGGIVINPQTGSIYAMAVSPEFNLNKYNEVDDPHLYQNPLVENVYEMGSIIKPLTMAFGLDSGVITPESTYNDEGYLELDGYRIANYDGRGRGVVSMQEVLNQSLNTGVANVVSKMGNKQFADYMFKLGVDQKTKIDLPNEGANLVDNLNSPRDIEHATASYGQGIALTPISATRALSALANGGYLIQPYVVKSISQNGLPDIDLTEGHIKKRVLKEETSETITRMLVKVVDDALAGGTVSLPRYSIAAKTGTAQIADEDGGGYYDDKYLHSFFGYFPAYDPQFLVFLFTVDPKNVRYASETLTDTFMNTAKFLLNYYEVPPDR